MCSSRVFNTTTDFIRSMFNIVTCPTKTSQHTTHPYNDYARLMFWPYNCEMDNKNNYSIECWSIVGGLFVLSSIVKIVYVEKESLRQERVCILGDALPAVFLPAPHLLHHTKPRRNSVKNVRTSELVHHDLIWRRDTSSRSVLGKIVKLSTCQLVLT